jgi:putative heme-binding domain-containing protein
MYVGPDGALYVVDYYRQIIEHPEWMGEEVVQSGQLYNGHDKGRIYRIMPVGAQKAEWTKGLKLGDASNEQLVAELANPNYWWRLNAQRLLIDRNNKSATPALMKMAQNTAAPLGRLHALWTLEGLENLTPELIAQALSDAVPGVRENAIKLAELHLRKTPELSKTLLTLQDDPDAKVRFQLLCTLGSVTTPEALQVRNKLLFQNINDEWMQVAALSGTAAQTAPLLELVLNRFREEVPAYGTLVQRLSAMIGAREMPTLIHQLIQKATAGQPAAWQAPLLEGLAQGLKNGKNAIISAGDQALLVANFFNTPSTKMRTASLDVLKATGLPDGNLKKVGLNKATAIAGDARQPEEKRVAAIQFIALGKVASHADLLKSLISPREQSSVQIAALRTLSAVPDTSSTQYLLHQWTTLTPEVQDAAMNTFLKDTMRIALLLDAIEQGRVQPASVGWQRSVRLMAQDNFRLRERARLLLTKNEAEGAKVNKEYQQALALEGNIKKGKDMYLKNCSVCHQVRGTMGVSFGPDLGTIHNWSAEAIMANILAPNLSISSGYDLWDVRLKNGESFQGIISSETTTAITLLNAGREVRTINRTDIQSLKPLNMSAMPAGLEKQINHQQMADLIAFLRANK